MKRNKRGISLIVLVITIIVMIILATVIIITLSNSGIIGRASQAVEDMNEAQMKDLVTLAWVDAYMTVTNEEKTDDWYYNYVIEYLKANGISQKELDKYIITADKNGANAILKSKVQSNYGFYYDMIYTGTIEMMGTQLNVGTVFFEDEKALTFMKVNDMAKLMGVEATIVPNEYIVFPDFGEWNLKYSNNTVVAIDPETGEEQNEKIEFSNEGKTATVVNSDIFPEGTILTLSEEEGTAHGIYLGEDYAGSVDGVGMYARINQDGSAALTVIANNAVQNMPAGSFELQLRNYAAVSTIEPILAGASVDGNVVYMMDESTGSINVFQRVGAEPEAPQANYVSHNGTIPEGGTYYVGVGNTVAGNYTGENVITYTAGQSFPSTVNAGDVYVYGDYEYRYNSMWTVEGWFAIGDDAMTESFGLQSGWGLAVIDKTKTNYGTILGEINNKFATSMQSTFVDCTEMITAPIIPSTIKSIAYAFMRCTKLTTVPDMSGATSLTSMYQAFYGCDKLVNVGTIAPNVTDMTETFHNCTSLVTVPDMSKMTQITEMDHTFWNCTSLKNVGTLPSSLIIVDGIFEGCSALEAAPNMSNLVNVESLNSLFAGCGSLKTVLDISGFTKLTDISYMYYGCKNITSASEIPSSVTNMDHTFIGCTSLKTAPTIPNNVTTMWSTFEGCTSLKTAPAIPNSVTNMRRTFYGCTALETVPTLSNSVTDMQNTFYGCTSLVTVPNIPSSVTNMRSTFEGCTLLKTAPTIQNNVTNMEYTFKGCTALNTVPTISNNVKYMEGTFEDCTALATAPAIPSSVMSLQNTFKNCINLTGTVTINTDNAAYLCAGCFEGTVKPITIAGSCSSTTKNNLKGTATNNNVN